MQGRRIWLVVALALALGAILTLVIRDSARLVERSFPGFLVWDNGTLVAFHLESWSGARAGLPVRGGRVVAVDGEPFAGGRALLDRVAGLEPGTPIGYRVSVQGELREFVVPVMQLGWGEFLATFGNYLFNAVCFFGIGLLALSLRPDLASARALAGATLWVGLLMTLAIDFLTTYRFVRLCQFVEAGTPVAIAHFALVFPTERFGAGRRRALIALLGAMAAALYVSNLALFYASPEASRRIAYAVYVLIAVVGVGLLASLGHALLRARVVKERVQAAIVFAGALVSFLLPVVAIVAILLLGFRFSFTWATALLFFFPVSILYAVVRYDLFRAERFIRLTVGYAVASYAVLAIYGLVVVALDEFVAPEVSDSRTVAFVFLLAIAVSFDPLRRRVQRGIDQIFYRAVVDVGRVLEASGTELAARSDEGEIARFVGEHLTRALSLEWAELATGDTPARSAALEEPVAFRGERLGAIRCGPKRSGAPFSAAERDLVRGIGSQAALALRNVRSYQALKEAQELLIRTERLAVIGEFAGSVAHGLRNPLASIRAGAQIAREQSREPVVAETLDGVLEDSQRLEQRIRSLLDFSRPLEPQPRPTAVGELIRAVARVVERPARSQGVDVGVEVAPALAPIDTDAASLEEALLELTGNALKAMPSGGALRLQAEANGARAVIRVADSGSGIPEGVRDRIFDLFFTTRSEGTGLGLATVKKIVERLGGEVVLESSGPDGTVFRITI